MHTATICAGFSQPVPQSQHAFRQTLDALARPGSIVPIGAPLPGVALPGALAHVLLTLTDNDTSVWWQQRDPELQQWLRFHTGASATDEPAQASFAVITQADIAPALRQFAQGFAHAPEFSSTLLVQVASLTGGETLHWRGPGIADEVAVSVAGLPSDFCAQWQANHASFPQGVDILFCCGESALGLPRSTQVRRAPGA